MAQENRLTEFAAVRPSLLFCGLHQRSERFISLENAQTFRDIGSAGSCPVPVNNVSSIVTERETAIGPHRSMLLVLWTVEIKRDLLPFQQLNNLSLQLWRKLFERHSVVLLPQEAVG
jgi:hypothetical protein